MGLKKLLLISAGFLVHCVAIFAREHVMNLNISENQGTKLTKGPFFLALEGNMCMFWGKHESKTRWRSTEHYR